MNTTRLFFLLFSYLTFFVSCLTYGQQSSLPFDKVTKTTTIDSAEIYGTADTGGGNAFKGRPLESYRIDPRSLPAYKKNIKPWLESQGLSGSSSVNALKAILDKKIWYLIPAQLKKLSPKQIGVDLKSDLPQAALQDFKQVWINKIIFDKMTLNEQALLLVHELFMGLRLLKYDSAFSECLAKSGGEHLQQCYNGNSEKPRGKPSSLNFVDYAQIRSASALITAQSANLTLEKFESILANQGFLRIHQKKIIPLEQLGVMIENSKLIKNWPTYGYNFGKFFEENQDIIFSGAKKSFVLNSDKKCDDIDIAITHQKISVSMVEDNKLVSYSHQWTAPISMFLMKDVFTGVSLYQASFDMLKADGTSAKKGDVVVNVDLKFLEAGLMGIDLSKTICTDDDCSNAGQAINGYRLLCYTRKSIQFTLGE